LVVDLTEQRECGEYPCWQGGGTSLVAVDARLLHAAKKVEGSPFLAEKIILSVHTGLRRGSLFHLRWNQWIF
jgi:hypothetical protein